MKITTTVLKEYLIRFNGVANNRCASASLFKNKEGDVTITKEGLYPDIIKAYKRIVGDNMELYVRSNSSFVTAFLERTNSGKIEYELYKQTEYTIPEDAEEITY